MRNGVTYRRHTEMKIKLCTEKSTMIHPSLLVHHSKGNRQSGASRRKGSRDDDGQNNPAEAARGSSRQITISARIQWKNLVKNKVSIIWRQGKEDHVIIWPVQVPMPLYLPSKPGSAS
ncbi:hypothetical protein VPH35_002953 [Triticum aestivum]